MSDLPQDAEGGHADDMGEPPAYQAPLPKVRDFLPWHLPRKQFVRQHQWCEQIALMLDENPLPDRILRYMGLPGLDLLDLRHFHSQLCETRGISLRFLGFVSGAVPDEENTELHISLDEVMRLPRIDHQSDVLGDKFELIANPDSIAWHRTRDLGPYDVVNLDLCDGFGSMSPGTMGQTYYDAVNKLLALQARSKRPWLLFLTTRTDRENVNADFLERLIEVYSKNLDACAPFREASSEEFDIETADMLREAVGREDGLLNVFLVGLCKWLLNLALAHNPPTSVDLRSVIGYRVNRGARHFDLVSLALRFTPTFGLTNDPVGLSGPSEALDECRLSTQALKRAAKPVDADSLLGSNSKLKQSMVDATASLLVLARYDEALYREWVDS